MHFHKEPDIIGVHYFERTFEVVKNPPQDFECAGNMLITSIKMSHLQLKWASHL